jgi:hypothetical protein
VKVFLWWHKPNLGKLRNSRLLAINWGQWWVSGYLTALRSLRWLQFIGVASGGREFCEGRAAVGGEDEHRCGEYVCNVVAVSPMVGKKIEGVTATRWQGWDTRRKAGERRFTGEFIDSSRRVEGKQGGVIGVESSSPAMNISPSRDVIR